MKTRMRRVLCLLLAVLLCAAVFSGCGMPRDRRPTETGDDRKVTETRSTTRPTMPKETEAPAKKAVVKIQFEEKVDESGIKVYAVIQGLNENGKTIWTRKTDSYTGAQLSPVEEVYQTASRYVYAERGTLLCLDVQTGKVLWENRDFGGAGAVVCEGSDGTLYLAGYFSPHFFAVDKDGDTLCRIESFGDEYSWTETIFLGGSYANVIMDLGPEDYRGVNGYTVSVDLDDYTVYRATEEYIQIQKNRTESVFINEMDYSAKNGKLWTFSKQQRSNTHTREDYRDDTEYVLRDTQPQGHTTGIVKDNKGNIYTYGLFLDSEPSDDVYICYELDGKYTRFTGVCGCPSSDIAVSKNTYWNDPNMGKTLRIYGDNELLFESDKMYCESKPQKIDIDVSGVEELMIYYPLEDRRPYEKATLFDGKLS